MRPLCQCRRRSQNPSVLHQLPAASGQGLVGCQQRLVLTQAALAARWAARSTCVVASSPGGSPWSHLAGSTSASSQRRPWQQLQGGDVASGDNCLRCGDCVIWYCCSPAGRWSSPVHDRPLRSPVQQQPRHPVQQLAPTRDARRWAALRAFPVAVQQKCLHRCAGARASACGPVPLLAPAPHRRKGFPPAKASRDEHR